MLIQFQNALRLTWGKAERRDGKPHIVFAKSSSENALNFLDVADSNLNHRLVEFHLLVVNLV